ncbi:NAD-dependent epimerase/dehydratase family protein [Mesorhizobium sp. B1-1-8]|uniref:NAD-dependent epimerase/dehydratase family protein n=1 Tax=Mesorhizobium sp. B1-1-8 TaxID=2589976 RepID=UPI00112CD72B|nr:NAD(P)-dependent oxidoreductase [Mesorhizobium sp. B1-1-8]UCI06843.1 NAD(P)-dependent oxidoreductase [Mesorhizobium sp. B1-1-8]
MILLTGATGFIGRHVVNALRATGTPVLAVVRDARRASALLGNDGLDWVECDLQTDPGPAVARSRECQRIIHLAWSGLPNYQGSFHLTTNLGADLKFLSAVAAEGVSQILVTGTCLEYGVQNGPLREDDRTFPSTPYGLAKDTLRKSLEYLALERGFVVQWVRLFYTFGQGQNPRSLLAQLDAAIDRGDASFDMSGGEQLRDYLPAPEIGRIVAGLLDTPSCAGIINCSSGQPVSIRRLVEQWRMDRKSDIRFNFGHYSYPDYEPMAFWGIPEKLRAHGLL